MAALKNPQHERASQGRAKGMTEIDAAEAAGYQRDKGNASRLFRRADVAARVAELMGKAAERTQISVAEVLDNMARIARADLRELYRPDGSLKPIAEWPEDAALAVAGVETSEIYRGAGKKRKVVGVTHKVKLWDKTKALDLLGRHFGMLKKVVEIKTPLSDVTDDELATIIAAVRAARAGAGKNAAGTGSGTSETRH